MNLGLNSKNMKPAYKYILALYSTYFLLETVLFLNSAQFLSVLFRIIILVLDFNP